MSWCAFAGGRGRVVVVVIVGCGQSSSPASNAQDSGVVDAPVADGPTTTCDDKHDAIGPACVPRFDACGPSDVG